MIYQSKHIGRCQNCDDSIIPGEDIERDPFTNSWVHAPCPEPEDDESDDDEHGPICAECWVTAPCFCATNELT